MKKLNIGCGGEILEGYVNLDYLKLKGVDVAHDLNSFPYPFKSNEFDFVYGNNILEHLQDLGKVMKEVHRILKPGGRARFIVPHFSSAGAFHDPTHLHYFGYRTFDYFDEYSHYFDFRLKVVSKRIVFGKKFSVWNYILEPLFNLIPIVYEDTPLRIFPAQYMDVTLEKLKE